MRTLKELTGKKPLGGAKGLTYDKAVGGYSHVVRVAAIGGNTVATCIALVKDNRLRPRWLNGLWWMGVCISGRSSKRCASEEGGKGKELGRMHPWLVIGG